MNEAGDRERAIFDAASQLPPRERADFLETACGRDERLRQRIVEALYQAAAKGSAHTPDQPESIARPTIAIVPADDSPGERCGDLIGPYRLLEQLGEGGMGSVWVAEQREPIRRKVALKVIKLGMDTKQVIARFEAERQALALMDHPNIAKVLDAGATDKGRPYFVMELVKGTKITSYCDLHNVRTRERLELFVEVCDAISHAHQKGIIHRDLKPANILAALRDTSPVPVIIDFGIAKAIGGQRLTDKTVYTAFEEFIGTPEYMSPEQAEMNPLSIDTRADIYALGVLLYELLTGLTPFAAERLRRLGPDEIRRIIREEDPPRPSTKLTTLHAEDRAAIARHHQSDSPRLLHLIRGDLDWIVMKCLEKDRTRRYQSCEALADDVRRYLSGKAVVARPPNPLYRTSKFVRRHKPAFAAAGLALVASAVAIAVAAFGWPGLFARRAPTPQQRLARADALLNHYDSAGAIPAAINEVKELLHSDDRNARAWATLGWANLLLYTEDQSDETRQEAFLSSSNAIRLNDKNPQAHLVQGLLASYLRDWTAATNHLLIAKQLTRSSDPIVFVSLAMVYQNLADSAQAVEMSQLAEQTAGANWQAYYRLGNYYKSDARDRGLQRTRDSFQRAVQLAPASPLAHRMLGQVLLVQGAIDAGTQELEQSLKLRPMPATLSALGSAWLKRGRFDMAANKFIDASRLDPSKYIFHMDAALALLNLTNRLPEATNHFEQALRQIQDSQADKPLIQAHRGLCEAGLGQADAARVHLEYALSNAGAETRIVGVVRDGFRLLGDEARASEIEQLLRKKARD
jgi:serine/threonine protein kinase/tetratricopeptide (TPR) repeat protein